MHVHLSLGATAGAVTVISTPTDAVLGFASTMWLSGVYIDALTETVRSADTQVQVLDASAFFRVVEVPASASEYGYALFINRAGFVVLLHTNAAAPTPTG